MKKAVFILLLLTAPYYLYSANFKDMTNITEEIWKDIPGFEGFYQASYSGKIRSVDRTTISNDTIHKQRHTFRKGRILKTSITKLGYVICYPSIESEKLTSTVHKLVALAWIPNPNNYSELNHIDTDKLNNSVPNLEWCDRGHNMRHAHANGLVKIKKRGENKIAKPVYQFSYDGFFIAEYACVMDAADATGIGFRQISAVATGKRKSTHGFKFSY